MRIFLFGISGKMGRKIVEFAPQYGAQIAGGFDMVPHPSFPTFDKVSEVNVPFDVIIDFTRPQTLPMLIELAQKNSAPLIIATTGYNEKEEQQIRALSSRVPVFKSANLSLGINAVSKAARLLKELLGKGFDIEITEKHHRAKVDAPSGTALLLADALKDGEAVVYGRQGLRGDNEIGVSSVRGGTVCGEHEIGFYGPDEIITITHTAASRDILARGALKAAQWLMGKDAGLYNMNDL